MKLNYQVIDKVMRNILGKKCGFGELGLKFRPFLIYHLPLLIKHKF